MSKRAPATSIYVAVASELHARIRRLGVTMWECDDGAGLQDGYTAKLLHPDTPSGRQARWETLQLLVDWLYPEGFVLVIRPKTNSGPKGTQKERNKTVDQRVRSVMMAMGRQGGLKSWETRRAKLTPQEKRLVTEKPRQARWRLKRKLKPRVGGQP